MSGPIPSRLIFLSELTTYTQGDKVRFLGWWELVSANMFTMSINAKYSVERYDPSSGLAVLNHNYPQSSPSVIAHVQLDHVLENVTPTMTQVGSWLNVIGTIRKSKRRSRRKSGNSRHLEITVDAIMVWEAKDLKLDDYEKAVEARKACNSTG